MGSRLCQTVCHSLVQNEGGAICFLVQLLTLHITVSRNRMTIVSVLEIVPLPFLRLFCSGCKSNAHCEVLPL